MPAPATDGVPDDEDVIELEPTMDVDLAGLRAVMTPVPGQAGPAVAPTDSAIASIAGDGGPLRRHRLAATALLLAVAYAILLAWHLMLWRPHGPLAWALISSRFVLSAAVAGLLLSPIRLSAPRVRALEFALFGGLTLIVMIAQYVVNLSFLQRGETIEMVAYMKNGVIQMVVLMLLYGTFIPNSPRTVAWVVLAMALAPLFSHAMLTEHPDLTHMAEKFSTVEYTGSNALFLLIAAGMAVCGCILLNGLRIELHQARKFGQYRLVRKLGGGGMGEVYLAEHQLLKRPCALKLIKPEAGSDPIALARFEREVQSAARLTHPNTIEIFDYGHTGDGTFYYVMEYLPGMSLAELVRRDGPLPPGRVIYLFRQVCAGLAEAHALGLVHRDLKPGNIFIAVRGGEADVAKVLDFGLVKLTRDPGAVELSSDMTVSGTPMYMAPEQALGDRSLDARADIYALGAMMYFALTGRPPFTGETAFAIMMAQARDPVVPPSQVQPVVPPDLERVVLRCLAKRPADRFPTARALGDALAGCASAADWGPNRAEAWWTAEGMVVSHESPAEPVGTPA
jgi:serine/threonine-protein kinase